MPGGITFDGTTSYIAFTAIKLVGYSWFGWYLDRLYSKSGLNFVLVGVSRTLLGMLFGAAVGLLGLITFELAMPFFLFGLLPVRIIEWWIILRVYYDRKGQDKERMRKYVGQGLAWSFVLDIPAIFGFLATGGLWIC